MNLEQTVTEKLNKAMKDQDKMRILTLRSLRASIIEFSKSGIGREMTTDDEMKLLLSAAKKRREAIEMFEAGGRPELKEQEENELAIIEEFLPKQISDEEIRSTVEAVASKMGATSMADMGKVIGLSMKELKGKAQGSRVQEIVKQVLSS